MKPPPPPSRSGPHPGGLLLHRLALALFLLAGACAGGNDRPEPPTATQWREVFTGPPPLTWSVNAGVPPEAPGEGGAPEASGDWTIVLVSYQGPSQTEYAYRAVEKVRTQAGLEGVRAERRGDATVVAFGRYEDPESGRAQADLKRIREMEVDGGRPFAPAVLAPPPDSVRGSLPQFDLRNVKDAVGADALYTLQVAIYTRTDEKRPSEEELAEFRRAAEQAVLQLRAQGEEAFYYHGPYSSTVTVGVFGEEDYRDDGNPMTPPEQSGRLLAARERHPHNLVNGEGVRERGAGGRARLQPSGLVAIPD